jgi:YHS domain-containing protein
MKGDTMKYKKAITFILAIAISMVAAGHRWGDSAHSMGLIKKDGGKARHASSFVSGKARYMLISTATVIPPYRGDVRVTVQGMPKMDYKLSLAGPVIDFGIKDFPKLDGNIITGLKPLDRLALWVEMKLPAVDPVCGMAHEDSFTRHTYKGKEYAFCNQMCLETFNKNPEQYRDLDHVQGKYTLAFVDTKTDKQVLGVPLVFRGKGEAQHGGGHH